jgi:hypothetical protein
VPRELLGQFYDAFAEYRFDRERWLRLAEDWITLAEQVDKGRRQLWPLI